MHLIIYPSSINRIEWRSAELQLGIQHASRLIEQWHSTWQPAPGTAGYDHPIGQWAPAHIGGSTRPVGVIRLIQA
jgi:hypothetical protein